MLPQPVDRVAAFLVEAGHQPSLAAAMASNLLPTVPVPHAVRQLTRPYRHLTMTPAERDEFASAMLARRVIAEGMLLSLSGSDVRDGTVLSAHALCEARTARTELRLNIGGHRASRDQLDAARVRLRAEIDELDALVEAAVASEQPLAVDSTSGSKANPRVVHLQNRLNSLGHRLLPDGVFGPMTHEAVKDFQTNAGLEASGVVDKITADSLRRGGRPSWGEVNAPPGTIPGQMTPGTPQQAAGQQQVNRESGNAAQQYDALSMSQPGEKDEGAGTVAKEKAGKDATTAAPDGKGRSKRRMTIHVDLGEAMLQERLDEARAELARATEGATVVRLRAKVRALEEAALSAKGRSNLKDGDFAIPESRSYPIHDRSHARNALARVSQHGSDNEKSRVRAAVKRRYPDLQESDVVEADSKGDYPATCPVCGAKMRSKGVCQRGHSVRKLTEATERQLREDGLLL